MGRTVSKASGYAPEDEAFDPRADDFISKERKYIHFDLPLTESARAGICFTSAEVNQHSFWPLLGFSSIERRAKKDKSSGKLSIELKERPIKFGYHGNAALFEWYTRELSEKYEIFLREKCFSNSVLAYRKALGDNIDQAKMLFDEISLRKNCTAIAVDIAGFFDHIQHSNLKNCLSEVLGCPSLPQDDFKIFSRMTKFEWVESEKLRERLGTLYGKKGRICTSLQFRNFVRGENPTLINVNHESFGIPQGTPLSGLYANISMAGFDLAMHKAISEIGGSYRRYSDDIAIILPPICDHVEVISNMERELLGIGLTLSHKKTDICKFSDLSGVLKTEKPFQYLGFTFDGTRVLIRQSSLNRYYAKMHSGIKSKVRAAKVKGIEREAIFLRQLYQRYTHFGRSRNFPRYAYRAAEKFRSKDILKQMSRHMGLFKKSLRYYLDRAY